MKKLLALTLVFCLLLLAGCGGSGETSAPTTDAPTTQATEPTTEPTAAPTTEAATEDTQPTTYINPLTGEAVEEAVDTRIFAVTINNVPAALPHSGVADADLYFEMFVNDYATRGLALFTDISQVGTVGSVRSLRYNFTDICQAYDAVVVHAGGSDAVLSDLGRAGVPHISVESEKADYYFRDQTRLAAGYATEHTLFIVGSLLAEYAQQKGIDTTQDVDRDYGLVFTENAAPADGEDAATVSINMVYASVTKNTTMVYNEETGLYGYNEYGYALYDGTTGEQEGFKNVIVMLCEVHNEGTYHVATLQGGGDGYFACDGKIISIQWHRDGDSEPFTFTLADGTPLEMGIGSSYICIAPLTSSVSWE